MEGFAAWVRFEKMRGMDYFLLAVFNQVGMVSHKTLNSMCVRVKYFFNKMVCSTYTH